MALSLICVLFNRDDGVVILMTNMIPMDMPAAIIRDIQDVANTDELIATRISIRSKT